MNKFLKICFRGEKFPVFLPKFMKYVSGLMFEEEPDYQYLKEIVQQVMFRTGPLAWALTVSTAHCTLYNTHICRRWFGPGAYWTTS